MIAEEQIYLGLLRDRNGSLRTRRNWSVNDAFEAKGGATATYSRSVSNHPARDRFSIEVGDRRYMLVRETYRGGRASRKPALWSDDVIEYKWVRDAEHQLPTDEELVELVLRIA